MSEKTTSNYLDETEKDVTKAKRKMEDLTKGFSSFKPRTTAEKEMSDSALVKRIASGKFGAQRRMSTMGGANQAAAMYNIDRDYSQMLTSERQKAELEERRDEKEDMKRREATIMAGTSSLLSQTYLRESQDKQLKHLKESEQLKKDAEIEKARMADAEGGKVICTQTMRQGLLCPAILRADEAYGRTLPREVMRGYHSWGIPVARTMKQFPLLTYFLAPFAWAWANEAAFRHNGSGESNLLGRLLLKIGIPLCKFLGRRM